MVMCVCMSISLESWSNAAGVEGQLHIKHGLIISVYDCVFNVFKLMCFFNEFKFNLKLNYTKKSERMLGYKNFYSAQSLSYN